MNYQLEAFSSAFRSESDRACGVLGAALLDEKLEQIFRSRLVTWHDELLNPERPLGALGVKTKLARALGWIGIDAEHELDAIRRMRNQFAHSADHELAFTDQSILDRCNNLRIPAAYIAGLESPECSLRKNLSGIAISSISTRLFSKPRSRFEFTVEIMAQHLQDLANNKPSDPSPDLLADVTALSKGWTIKIEAKGTVAPPASLRNDPT